MSKANAVFLTIVILASVNRGEIVVEHPEVGIKSPAVFGKPATPTPTGIYTLDKFYSTKMKQNILVFRQDESGVYAIHANLKGRTPHLQSATPLDNFLSNGCIGVDQKTFDRLWDQKQQLILQVY